MSAGAIEAGKGFVRIFTDLSPLDKGLKQLEAKMQGLGSSISSIGGRVAGIGAGAAALGASILAPVAAATKMFADFGSTIKDTSDRTGISAQSISELGYAAEQSGTDLATVEGATRKMQKGIQGAVGGNKAMSQSFESIGLSAKSLAQLSPEQQFEAVAKAVGSIANPTMRAGKAMEIFGKSGTKLLPMIKDMDALRQEARELGISISDIDAANAEELGDAFSKFARVIQGIGNQIGAAVAAPLTKIINAISTVVATASKWIAANQGLVRTIAGIAAGFVAVGGIVFGLGIAIVGIGATIAALGTIIGGIVATVTTVFGAVATVVGAILSPIGLVVAAVVGLGAYITYTALTATGSITKLGEMFGGLGSVVTTTWGGIVAALSTGDLAAAGEIAFTALEVGWLTVTTTMRQIWQNVSDFFVNVWLGAVESIVKIGANIYFGIAKYFDLITTSIVGAFDNAGVGIYGSIDKIATYIYGAFDTAVTNIIGLFDSIWTTLEKLGIAASKFFGTISPEEAQKYNDRASAAYEKRTGERNGALNTRRDERQSNIDTRAGERQTNLDSRAKERQTGIDKRDQSRQATAQQFDQIVSEDFKRRKTTVENPGLTEAQKRLEELKVNLQTKAAEAQTKAAEAQKDGPAKVEAAQQAISTIKNESGGSTGTFVSGVSASIAGGGVSPLEDLGKQQLEALNSIDGRLREATVEDDE